MQNTHKKIIRRLEKRAEIQDISAIFQLYKNNQNDDNKDLAKQYLSNCEEILNNPETQLTLNEVELIDFKRFHSLKISFHNQLTVIVGENGTGKTTTLNAISKCLSWISASIEKEKKQGKYISTTEINTSSQQYAEIGVKFSLTKNTSFDMTLSKVIPGAEEKKDNYVVEVKSLADIYRIVNSNHKINLPIFAFYTIERSRINNATSREILNANNRQFQMDAYTNCLDDSMNFTACLDWFSQLDNRLQPQMRVTPEQIKKYEKLKNELYQKLEKEGIFDRVLLTQYQQEEQKILHPQPSEDTVAAKHWETARNVILGMIPNITDFFIDRSSGNPELKIEINNTLIGIGQLSDGQKSVIALISDLVRRLIMLNPNRENPLEGQGIVLIDEIELHLHPQWQQMILPKLLKIFPKIQFIVTSHSPQVLSTVRKENIRILMDTEDGVTAGIPDISPLGRSASDALARILMTHNHPQLPVLDDVQRYEQLVRNNEINTPNAIDLLQKLQSAGYEIPESDLATWVFLANRKSRNNPQ